MSEEMREWATVTGCATVLLHHRLPDGTSHIDWMVARDQEAHAPLLTFRMIERLDRAAVGQTLGATRIGDHRPTYLTYEGPVSGNRGTVVRLAAGIIELADVRTGSIRLRIAWHGSPPQRVGFDLQPGTPVGGWNLIVRLAEDVVG